MHSYYTIMYLIVLHFIRSCFIHTNRSHSFIQFFFFSSNRLGQNSPINDGQNGSFQFLVIKTSAIRKIFEDVYVKHGYPHGKHLPAQPGPQRPDSYHFSFPVVKTIPRSGSVYSIVFQKVHFPRFGQQQLRRPVGIILN